MKNKVLYMLSLLPILALAQPKLVRQTTETLTDNGWQLKSKVEYLYNKQGQETSRVASKLEDENAWVVVQISKNEYAANGQLTRNSNLQKRPDTPQLQLYTQTDYLYHPNGCLASELYQNFLQNGELGYATQTSYFTDENCRKDSTVAMSCDSVGSLLRCEPSAYSVFEYSASGTTTVQHQGVWNAQNGGFDRQDSVYVHINDESGRLSVQFINYSGQKAKVLYTYYEDETLATITTFKLDANGNWVWLRADSTSYEYGFDANGFINHKSVATLYLPMETIITNKSDFFNYCDGLPRVEIINDQIRKTYEYTAGIDCGIDRLFTKPAIYPNPASERLVVQYPPMSKGRTTVRIFTAQGAEAIGYTVNFRTYDIELDVSQLPIGVYFLRVLDGKRKIGKKIMVLR